MAAPRLVVHDLAQALAALRAAAETGVEVMLESPPGAVRYLGAPYFLEMIAAARDAAPGARCESVLDCGDAPGLALDALRRGAKRIRLAADPATLARVGDIARQSGATVEAGPAPAGALDLARERDPQAAVRRRLAQGAP